MPERNRVIGICGTAMSERLSRIFNGVLRYVNEKGGFTIRDFRFVDPFAYKHLKPPTWTGRCDGAILQVGRNMNLSDAQMGDWVLSGRTPVVNTTADWTDPRVHCVKANQSLIGTMAARHLMQAGARSFLFLGFQGSTAGRLRFDAYRAELQRAGHDCVEHPMPFRAVGADGEKEQMLDDGRLIGLLTEMPRPLAVWAINDVYASLVHPLCARLGLRIPDDIRLMGVDDLAVARELKPQLTTIRSPFEEIGYRAMRTLHHVLEGRRVGPRRIELNGLTLVERASTVKSENDQPGDIAEALDYIRRHACAGISVLEVAEHLGFPRRTFERRFRSVVGHSAGQEIHRIRIEHANQLLAQSRLSIGRIALMVGFEDIAAFSKFYRKHTGLSPRAHRRQES